MTGFDVDAWIDGAQPPTRAVRVYGRGDLVARLQALALAHEEQAPPTINDLRLGGDAPSAQANVGEQLLAELEASAAVFTVQGYDPWEWKAHLATHTTTADDGSKSLDEAAFQAAVMADCAVEPKLTVKQAARLRKQIGLAQWNVLFEALQAAAEEPIDVPLSRLGSGTVQDS